MKEMPIGDASIEGTQDKPYSKTSFLEKINRKTEDKARWLYTFSGYTNGIYESGKNSYIDVAQKNKIGAFANLWPGSSTPTNTTIIEISKREKDGKLPENAESAAKLDPTMLLSYQWHTIIIPLKNILFQSNQWFDVLDKVYETIDTYMQQYKAAIGEDDSKNIHDFVIKTLQEKNYLKAELSDTAKKTTWGIAGSIRDLFSWFFGAKENNN